MGSALGASAGSAARCATAFSPVTHAGTSFDPLLSPSSERVTNIAAENHVEYETAFPLRTPYAPRRRSPCERKRGFSNTHCRSTPRSSVISLEQTNLSNEPNARTRPYRPNTPSPLSLTNPLLSPLHHAAVTPSARGRSGSSVRSCLTHHVLLTTLSSSKMQTSIMSLLQVATFFFAVAVGQTQANGETLATITSCTASSYQTNPNSMPCSHAYDGVINSGWGAGLGQGDFSWANFQLSEPSIVTGLNIDTGDTPNTHTPKKHWTDFKISLKVGDRYIEPTNVKLVRPGQTVGQRYGVQFAGGRISNLAYDQERFPSLLKITFDAVAGVTDVKTCVSVLPSSQPPSPRRRLSFAFLSISPPSSHHTIHPSHNSATCTTRITTLTLVNSTRSQSLPGRPRRWCATMRA